MARTKLKGFTRSPYRGVTKRLDLKLFSKGSLPRAKLHTVKGRRGWEGRNAGRRRGMAVDRQLSAIANQTTKRFKFSSIVSSWTAKARLGVAGLYSHTELALRTLHMHGMLPVCAQRGVCNEKHNLATAIDLLCWKEATRELWVVEIKCGFEDVRDKPARRAGRELHFASPFQACVDHAFHRHLAQLAVTHHMFASESELMARLRSEFGFEGLHGCVLYIGEQGAEMVVLEDWWRRRANKMLQTIA